jgi:Peptidase family M28/PDZ domain/PA domain
MRTLYLFGGLLLVGSSFATEPNADEYLGYVKFLASEDMRGRATGSPELERAAEFLRGQFRALHLKPIEHDSYYQDFEVTTSAKLGEDNQFSYRESDRKAKAIKFQQDFVPLNLSTAGHVAGGVVFCGFGITAPEYNYDDYAGVDVRGKIVLVLRHEPQEYDEKSVFEGKVYTLHSQIFSKAVNAKMHGAKAVLLVNDVEAHSTETDELEKFGGTAGPANSGIEFLQVRAETVDKWLEKSGKDLRTLEQGIDKDLKPRSFALPGAFEVDVNVDIRREIKTVHNVGGYLPGETAEYVIVGAHYDHLGLGEQYSLAPSLAGTVHPGADDNASGTAGVLELAHWFAQGPKPHRGILFLAFAGEELGLLGSNHYANHPDLPLDKCVAMINMDMIGRIRDHKIYVGGIGTGSTFAPLVKRAAERNTLDADLTETTGYGSSDHTSFTAKQIPVLFFFSGLHSDYHKPSDTWDKIDAPAAVTCLHMVSDVIEGLSRDEGRPEFVRVAEPKAHGEEAGDAAAAHSGKVSGYGPDFGSIPDFTELPNGVRFADIRPGSPAAKAGLKAGDILTEFGGKPIQNLYDFTYALRARKPGDEVLVKVLRSGQTIEAKVLLTERR